MADPADAERPVPPERGPGGLAIHDVVIVGGGAVGLLLACLLGRRGRDVVVLERRAEAPPPGAPSRAIGIHPPGLKALDHAGVGESVRERAVLIREGRVTCEGRTLGALRFPRSALVRSLPQREVEALLEERLAGLATVDLRRGVEAAALRDRGTHVEVTATEAGAEVAVPARYVVGADGVRSGIRSLIEARWRPRGRAATYVMCDARDDTGAPETALLHFEPTGVVESFPMPGGMRRYVARVRRRPSVLDASAVAAIVEARTGAGFDVDAAGRPTAFDAHQHLAQPIAVGRVALVGDAAHEISPIGGQGMNLGWIGAQHLAHELEAALAAGAPLDAFAAYERGRRSAATRAMRQAAFNMRMGAPVAGLRLRARNASVRVLALPPTRAALARAFTMRWL
ncbi:FAD-dependent oxidoreductase [Agromyces arachidis]|uniref:FAD-dependent oxidoreductase n=1 Tax=Agromyces arachidis TaxID=766966 RepID=UPI004056AF10